MIVSTRTVTAAAKVVPPVKTPAHASSSLILELRFAQPGQAGASVVILRVLSVLTLSGSAGRPGPVAGGLMAGAC
jgi:hypothetical protein